MLATCFVQPLDLVKNRMQVRELTFNYPLMTLLGDESCSRRQERDFGQRPDERH